MADAPNRRSAGSRIFRSLLRLLPFDFRVEHGREMEQVFRAQQQGANLRGVRRYRSVFPGPLGTFTAGDD
jgi:hypothetical protein